MKGTPPKRSLLIIGKNIEHIDQAYLSRFTNFIKNDKKRTAQYESTLQSTLIDFLKDKEKYEEIFIDAHGIIA